MQQFLTVYVGATLGGITDQERGKGRTESHLIHPDLGQSKPQDLVGPFNQYLPSAQVSAATPSLQLERNGFL